MMVGLWPVRERVFTLRESEALGLACMVASSALFALMGLCVKLAGQSLPVEEITLVRAAGGLMVTTVMMLIRPPGHPPRQVPWLLARGALGWAALVCYFQAIARLPLADAVFLNYTSPFFTAVLAGWLLRERITPGMRLAMALGLGGVAVLVHPGGGPFQPGTVLGLGSGVLAAGAYVAVKRATSENDPLTIVWCFSLVATVLSVPLAWTHLARPSPVGWLAMGGGALTATVAQVLMTHGYRLARATPASIVSLFTPLFAALLGIVAFGDVPGWGTWIGGSLIVGAGILLARGSRST